MLLRFHRIVSRTELRGSRWGEFPERRFLGGTGGYARRRREMHVSLAPATRMSAAANACNPMMRVAPSSAAAHDGSAPSSPPSEYQCFPMRTCGSAKGSAQDAARCRHVISESRKIRGFIRGSSTAVTANGIRSAYLGHHPADVGRQIRKTGECGIQPHAPELFGAAAAGDHITVERSHRGAYDQIWLGCGSASTLQAPACHAPNKPPPESTNASMRNCSVLHEI